MYRLQVISYAWEHHLFVNSSSSNHQDGIRLLGGIVAEKNPSLVLRQMMIGYPAEKREALVYVRDWCYNGCLNLRVVKIIKHHLSLSLKDISRHGNYINITHFLPQGKCGRSMQRCYF